MKIIESGSAWDLEDLLRTTIYRLKRTSLPKWRIASELERFLNRLPDCSFEDIKRILNKPQFQMGD